MAIRVQILFVGGIDGDDVGGYTPEVDVVGGGIIDSGANGMELDGAGACKWAVAGDYFMIDAGIHEQRVITKYNAGGADNRVQIYARALSATIGASNDRYQCLIRPGHADEIQIIKGGTGSGTIATLSSFAWNLSTTYTIDFRVTTNGANVDLEVWINGALELSGTDSTSPYTAGDFAGLTGFLRTDANGRWLDFQVQDLVAYNLTLDSGSYALAGSDMTLSQGYQLSLDAGSYSLVGSDMGLAQGHQLDLETGSYSLTGSDMALSQGYKISLEAGSYSLTGSDMALSQGYQITLESGIYNLVGSDMTLSQGYKISLEAGSYSLAGSNMSLIYTSGGASIVLESGNYLLTGSDMNLTQGYALALDSGSYSLVGSDMTLVYSGAIAGLSFRALIKASSGLGEGVAVRDHLNNLGGGGGDITINSISELGVELDVSSVVALVDSQDIAVEIEVPPEISVIIDDPETEVIIESKTTEVNI